MVSKISYFYACAIHQLVVYGIVSFLERVTRRLNCPKFFIGKRFLGRDYDSIKFCWSWSPFLNS